MRGRKVYRCADRTEHARFHPRANVYGERRSDLPITAAFAALSQDFLDRLFSSLRFDSDGGRRRLPRIGASLRSASMIESTSIATASGSCPLASTILFTSARVFS